ncbi:MAG: twin-arginine translocase TatA/TatE family subunit [Bacteriovoracaceae bacterium]
MFGLGVGEIVIILFIALIFIGPKKLPELAKGLGKGMREFQNAAKGLQDHIKNPIEETKQEILNDSPSARPDDSQAVAQNEATAPEEPKK